MTEKEGQFGIRPKLRIGAGGQTTFLPGSGVEATVSLRKATGVTPDDEEKARDIIKNTVIFPIIRREHPGRGARVESLEFGADLGEWRARIMISQAEGGEMLVLESPPWKSAHRRRN
jgi:hypothetical protein